MCVWTQLTQLRRDDVTGPDHFHCSDVPITFQQRNFVIPIFVEATLFVMSLEHAENVPNDQTGTL